MLDRRDLLLGAAAAALTAPALARGDQGTSRGAASLGAADHTIRIANSLVELGPDLTLSTKTYNGQFPGPLLRMTAGKPVVVDIHNDTDTPEQLHWHGQVLPADVDGAAEEGTTFIPAHGTRRVAFTPGPAGFRFFHSHVGA